jgi:hypothetical protein
MRKFILIAGFVLASAAAQAGDRSLSLGGVETAAPAPARATGASKSAEAPQAVEAPKYVERPAVVEPKPEAAGTETTRTETARPRASRAARMHRASAGRMSAAPGRPAARRTAYMSRNARPPSLRYSIKARIIGALHRHGIYW